MAGLVACLSDLVDLVRANGEDDANLVPTSVPRVRAAKVAPGEEFDVFRTAFGREIHHPAADRVVAGGVRRVGNAHGHPWVALDVLHLLEALDRVDQDVVTVGVDPCLGHLG